MNTTKIIFKVHLVSIAIYYAALIAWTLISAPLLIGTSPGISTLHLVMIAFVIAITWYWSLGLVYCIELENSRVVRLKSLRGNLTLKVNDVRRIIAPPSRIQIGFLRLCLARKTFYTFFSQSEPLKDILVTIRKHSPDTQFVKFSACYFEESLT